MECQQRKDWITIVILIELTITFNKNSNDKIRYEKVLILKEEVNIIHWIISFLKLILFKFNKKFCLKISSIDKFLLNMFYWFSFYFINYILI